MENKNESAGLSFDDAIVINETSGNEGVNSEYEWLRQNYSGYQFISQRLCSENNKHYDVIKIFINGKKAEIFFDISNFFGKD